MKNILTTDEISTIKHICDKFDITNYTINQDGSIDVAGDVKLQGRRLNALPLIFNKVTGNFCCAKNLLTSLKGCPKEVGGNFRCGGNSLTSLEYGPNLVGGNYTCSNNELSTLYGIAHRIGLEFFCSRDNLGLFGVLFAELTFRDRQIFIRFMHYYEVWTPEFNEENMRDLLEDIKEGLR